MEISENTVIDLIKGQATLAQAVKDQGDKIDKGLQFLYNEHRDLNNRVSKIEKKVWYTSGSLGLVGGVLVTYIKTKLGL